MTVTFRSLDGSIDVTYGWDPRAPVEGETIRTAGDDVSFPAGAYRVAAVAWVVTKRGPCRTVVSIVRQGD